MKATIEEFMMKDGKFLEVVLFKLLNDILEL